MSDTQKYLKEAFAGESQASQKYLAFAKKAKQDGYPNIAQLFRTAAKAESIHAEGHLKAADGIGTTAKNLQAAIDGETHEYKEMYPPMLEKAEADQHKAKRMFSYALGAEEVHAQLYNLALESVQRGADLSVTDFYLCPICGYIEFGEPTESCPICGTKPNKFILV